MRSAAWASVSVAWPSNKLGKGVPSRILFATLVGYLVIAYFVLRLVVQALVSA